MNAETRLNWANCSKCVDIVKEHLDRSDYFELKDNIATPTKLQRSVVRIQSLDCLDRTNIVQVSATCLRLLTRSSA